MDTVLINCVLAAEVAVSSHELHRGRVDEKQDAVFPELWHMGPFGVDFVDEQLEKGEMLCPLASLEQNQIVGPAM